MMDPALRDLGEFLEAALPHAVQTMTVNGDELSVRVARDQIVRVLKFLRDDPNCQFRQLVDVCGVDHLEEVERFEVVYHLLSLTQNRRIRVKVRTGEAEPVPTVTGVFGSANWYEREAWDMYGILFDGHPDLRRLLSDYGFQGHAQRKDFPLTGYVEVRYDDEQKRVVYEPVRLPQEYRNFDFLSPWDGMTRLPGDEKAGTGEAR